MRKTLGLISVPVVGWPVQDVASWREALVPGGVFDQGGFLANRKKRDLTRLQSRFGVWLAYLAQASDTNVITSGMDFLNEAHLRPFLQLLESKIASYSVLSFLGDLHTAAKAMAPGRNFSVLQQAIRHCKRAAKPSRDKRSRLRFPEELHALGTSLMQTTQRGTARVRYSNRYLDGLAIAMLAAMPLRIGNLGSLQLGRSIQRIGNCYWISIEGDSTKNGRPIEFALPTNLTEPIERYIIEHRPYLLAQAGQSSEGPKTAFWLSSWGTPLHSELLAKRISQRTREAFRQSMSPHLFRDAVATTIATEDPEHVGMILPILGHSSLKVSEKHYNQAKTLESSRRYLSILETLRKGA